MKTKINRKKMVDCKMSSVNTGIVLKVYEYI